ncbi:MAG: hypothetical protein NT007_13485 [Candidatus Kapabacteria bacterium]|nr:hypothetical protein [Candidatus Kapabacteria bacterium]
MPLFIVESKRLPSKTYEKEYVIGEKKNGGIERFKIEKHGKGLSECGLFGFIELETFENWQSKINKWINELASIDETWADEQLSLNEMKCDYSYLTSNVKRVSSDDVLLHHFWVKIE